MAIWDKWLISMRYLFVSKIRGGLRQHCSMEVSLQQTANFKVKMVPIHDGSNAPHQKRRSGGILVGILNYQAMPSDNRDHTSFKRMTICRPHEIKYQRRNNRLEAKRTSTGMLSQ